MNRIDSTNLIPAPPSAPAEAARAEPGDGESFVDAVKGLLESANRDQSEAERQAIALAEGKGDIVDAMVALSKADLSLRFVVTLRNRAVEAYREIMNLQL